MNHRVILARGPVEDVGEMVFHRPFEVTIADPPAEVDRREAVEQSRLHIAGRGFGEGKSGQGGDPRGGVVLIGGRHGSTGLDPGRLGIPRRQGDEAQGAMGRTDRGCIIRLDCRIEGGTCGGTGVAEVPAEPQDHALVHQGPGHERRLRRALERGLEVAGGRHEIPAAQLRPGDEALDLRDRAGVGGGRGRLERGDRAGVVAQPRP